MNPQPLYPQLRRLILQTIKACPTLGGLYIWIILVRIAPSQQITPSLLHRFTPQNKLPHHSYTILPPLAAQPLHHFTPSEQKKNPHSYTILSPLAAQLLHHFTPSEQITPSLLQHFTLLGSPTLTSFYPLWTNYPLTLTTFYPSWQPNSYIIKTPLNKLPPHSYNNLPPLAAQLLHHLTPSGQITPLILHHFNPLGSPTLTSFHPLWTNYHLTLTPFYPPPPLAAHIVAHVTPSGKINLSLLQHFPPLGSPTLTSFYPLWTNHPLTLTPFIPPPPFYPLLHGNFSHGWGNSWKVLPLQLIAAHSYMAISVRGVIPEKSSHCSPLPPALTWQFQSGG